MKNARRGRPRKADVHIDPCDNRLIHVSHNMAKPVSVSHNMHKPVIDQASGVGGEGRHGGYLVVLEVSRISTDTGGA